MKEEKILKFECVLDHVIYPKYSKEIKSKEFGIFRAIVTKLLEGTEYDSEEIKLKGICPHVVYGTTYKVYAKLTDVHDMYGNTYEIVYMSKCVDISDKDKQKEFLKNILNEKLVDRLFDEYDDVITLLENRDIKSLMKIKGIGNQVALKMIDEYEESKDYSSIYIELGQLGLTHTFIKKLMDFYHSPDTVVDVVRRDPYDLVRIDGIGFKKADEVACKVGIGQYDTKRIKGFLLYYLSEQGELGKSYLTYKELIDALYTTLGHVPEDIINKVAANLIKNKDVVVLENGMKIALTKFHNLENNIKNELLRLQIGLVNVNDSKDNTKRKSLFKDYIPRSLATKDWQSVIQRVEKEQDFEFTDEQKDAIKMSIDNNVIFLTGGAGCVDCDTEFFDGYGWKRIADYSVGDKVLQYNKNGTTDLVEPLRYIKQPKEYLWHLKTDRLDQCLSENHNCILYSAESNEIYEEHFDSIMQKYKELKFNDYFITGFQYNCGKGIKISDDMLRFMTIVLLWGKYYWDIDNSIMQETPVLITLPSLIDFKTVKCIVKRLHLFYGVDETKNEILVNVPFRINEIPHEWYNCSQHQLSIIREEINLYFLHNYLYDSQNITIYHSSYKRNADFIQFIISAYNIESIIEEKNNEYYVYISTSTEPSLEPFTYNDSSSINKYKTKDGYEYCFTVPSHMLVLRRNNKIFITGNCGKTTTAKGICSLYDDYNILACALSGKASVRITEATGLPASTIHRALGYQDGYFFFNKENKLAVDVVLIDEATMINGILFLSLLEAIPTGAKVIIMGDVQQLTPIGNCQVFADVLDSNVLPIVRLTKPHRQALMSGIIPTSIKIAHQEPIFSNRFEGHEIIGDLKDMEFDITSSKEAIADKIITYFQREMNKYNDIMEVQICVPMRLRGELSCYNLNTKIQDIYNPKLNDDNEIEILLEKKNEDTKKYHIRVGDKVLNTKNNYKCVNSDGDLTPVFNGNMGIVKSIEDNGYCVIDFIGIGEVVFSKTDSKNLELAYACTVHKMQGSGFTSTIVGIDTSSYIMNNSELLYTAITRAKKYCILVGNNYAITRAIQTKEVKCKQTFLKDMLLNSKYKIIKTIKEKQNQEVV